MEGVTPLPKSVYPTPEDNKPADMKVNSDEDLRKFLDDFNSERLKESGAWSPDDDIVDAEIIDITEGDKLNHLNALQFELGGKLTNLLERVANLPLDAWRPYIEDRIKELAVTELQYIIDNAKDVIRLMEQCQELMPHV